MSNSFILVNFTDLNTHFHLPFFNSLYTSVFFLTNFMIQHINQIHYTYSVQWPLPLREVDEDTRINEVMMPHSSPTKK